MALLVPVLSSAAERPLPRGAALELPLPAVAGAAAALAGLPRTELPPSVCLRAQVRWADLESAPGVFFWEDLERAVRAAREASLPLILVLTGPGPEGLGVPVEDGAALERWLAFVEGAVERTGDAALAWQVWEDASEAEAWGRPPSVREYAFLLKKTALAIKGVDPEARVAQGSLPLSVSFQRDLFDEGIAPFLDAYAVDPHDASGDSEHAFALLGQLVAERDPGAALWVGMGPAASESGGPGSADELWSSLIEAREAGTELALVERPMSAQVARVLSTYARAFPHDASPAVAGSRRLVQFDGARVRWSRHVVASDLSQRVVYRPAEAGGGEVVARLSDAAAEGVRLHDPEGEHDREVKDAFELSDKGYVRARLPLPERPLVLEFRRDVDSETLSEEQRVGAERTWTVEEVLARHLEVQAAERHSLEDWTAELVTSMQYRLGTVNQPVNVRVEGRYFRRADGTAEVENQRFFLNGAPFDSKRPPELPLLQPEKVTVVPLDVHLDRSYRYRLEGEDVVDGRPAFRVGFEPIAREGERRSERRQQGTVWIDKESFRKLRLRAADTALEPPILSNQQTDSYAPVEGADGRVHWLVHRSEISRSVVLIGATIQVFMRMEFSGHRANDPAVEERLAEAYASPHQMLRETEEGFRYLRTDGEGGRQLAEESSRKLFFVAGLRHDDAFDGILPLAGVNWLDYDLGGKGLQLNLFAAGAINTLSLSDPSLFGTRVEGGFDLFLPAIKRRDRLRLPGAEIDERQETRTWRPSLDVNVNAPLGAFGKIGASLGLAYESWHDGDDTSADFLLPENGLVVSAQISGEVNRRGWKGRAFIERAWRSDWEPWGPADGTLGGDEHFEDGDDAYWRWGARLTKDWLISSLQRVDLQLDYYGGSGLDRFSQYEFGGIAGPQVSGFSGSGIHFDRAGIARLGWGVDIAGMFGLRVQADYAQIWNRELPEAVEAAFGDSSAVAGVGLTGTVPGPWGTFVTFDLGWAAWAEDHEDAVGSIVAQVLFWKFLR